MLYRKEKSRSPGTQMAIGLGYQLLAAILLFAGAGYYIDKKRGGGHLFTLIGVAMAFLYGGYEVWKLVKVMTEEDNAAHQKNPEEKD